MNTIAVNISANKSWINSAEDLLTRYSPDITTLITELSSSADYHIGKLKRDKERHEVISHLTTITAAIITGWRAGTKLQELPKAWAGDDESSERVKHLIQPYCARGYSICMAQIEQLQKRGEHSSQHRVKMTDSTQDEPHESGS